MKKSELDKLAHDKADRDQDDWKEGFRKALDYVKAKVYQIALDNSDGSFKSNPSILHDEIWEICHIEEDE